MTRSLLVLRLLTHGGTGGIVAAPTTSLPEDFGGSRNWDYRYCWLRDASLTVEALLASGFDQETRLWRGWLLRAIAGDPEDMQIMYAVDGARELPERELDAPARLRRLAAGPARQRGGRPAPDRRARRGDGRPGGRPAGRHPRLGGLLGAAAHAGRGPRRSTGTQPDNGIWEIRGDRSSTSPTPASWSGRRSTGPSRRSSGTASTDRSSGGGRCGRRCARRC